MLRVKICGTTRADDALAAVALGADAIGMIFYDHSPRCVKAADAAAIVRNLPPWVARVGVFVDAEVEIVRETAHQAGLTAIQLHGSETVEYIRALNVNLPIIKALPAAPGWPERAAEFAGYPILLDHAGGGTGEPWDWGSFDPKARPAYFILAGGLNPGNVARAVKHLHPDAIDVSSGVEREPGIKDREKLKELFAAVRVFRQAGASDGHAS